MRESKEIRQRIDLLTEEMAQIDRELEVVQVIGPLTNPIESLTRLIALKVARATDQGAHTALRWAAGEDVWDA